MAQTLQIELLVNGDEIRRVVPASETLLELLRERLGLTGAKPSCTLELCGTCTVLLDGAPVSACTLLAADADGSEVLTVEGLGGPSAETLHRLQAAFVDHGALQCGYCTPGFLMTATALLARDPDPSEETIRHELHGNICRCTGYAPIVAAIRAVAEQGRDAAPRETAEDATPDAGLPHETAEDAASDAGLPHETAEDATPDAGAAA